jgi:hypothetical protein
MNVEQLKFGGKAKKLTCFGCPSFIRLAENIGLCEKFNFEVWTSLARKTRVCEELEDPLKPRFGGRKRLH